MRSIRSLTRYQATTGHVVISLVIGLLVLGLMLFLWYPSPLFVAMGGGELLFLIVGVDVFIGPLITLIIFNPKKKSLVFDLSVIALLQMAALGYGIVAMYSGRPVYIVATDMGFKVVSAAELDPKDIADAHFDDYKTLSLTGPRLVGTKPPEDPKIRSDLAFSSAFGLGVESFPKYYVPFDEVRKEMIDLAKPVNRLDLNETDSRILTRYLQEQSKREQDVKCLPVVAKRQQLMAIIDAENGAFLSMLPIKPALK
jgi:hypothetical protein